MTPSVLSDYLAALETIIKLETNYRLRRIAVKRYLELTEKDIGHADNT